jgi:hypothetical protein
MSRHPRLVIELRTYTRTQDDRRRSVTKEAAATQPNPYLLLLIWRVKCRNFPLHNSVVLQFIQNRLNEL